MYVCVRVRVYAWGRRSWEKRKEMKEKRVKKEGRREKRNLFIQINRQTDGWTDGQIDTNHSLIWDTKLNNIVNQIQ